MNRKQWTVIFMLVWGGFLSLSAQSKFDLAFYPLLGKPYGMQTLEKGPEEPLTINFDSVDCTTFVEYVIAAQLTHSVPHASDPFYQVVLSSLRYRKGLRQGYLSRIHYFTEWIEQQKELGRMKEITPKAYSVAAKKSINFMSSHPQFYPVLAQDSLLVDSLKLIEAQVNRIRWSFIPIHKVGQAIPVLDKGDLIAIVTSVDGLDISHVGFAYPVNGQMHLLHASTVAKKVVIDPMPLEQYLMRNPKNLGIRILRMVDHQGVK